MAIIEEAKDLIVKLKDLKFRYNIRYREILREMLDVNDDSEYADVIKEVLSNKLGEEVMKPRILIDLHLRYLEPLVEANDEGKLQEYFEENQDDINNLLSKKPE